MSVCTLVSFPCMCVWFSYMLSQPLPGCDVVYDPWAAVGHVVQGGVRVVEGWRVVLLLDVVRQQVGEAARTKQTEANQNVGEHTEITAAPFLRCCNVLHM